MSSNSILFSTLNARIIKTCTCFLFLIRYFADSEECMSRCKASDGKHSKAAISPLLWLFAKNNNWSWSRYLIVRCAVSHLPFQTLSWGRSRHLRAAPRNWYEVSWLDGSSSLSNGGPQSSQPGAGEQDESRSLQTLRAAARRLMCSLKCFHSLWWEIVQIKPQTLWHEKLIPRHAL